MKVCGFTIVKNAAKFYYPIKESILSILPLCDKFIIALGDCDSDDTTRELLESIGSPKIEIFDTVWDKSLQKGGTVLAVETNKAFDAIPAEYDWCFYLQADEVIHEEYHSEIKAAMEKYLNDTEVEGLLFKYRHFWGTYDYIGINRQWYRQEIRIIRNDKAIRSYGDAQGFRKNDKKLKVAPVNAYVNHYGWVRPPEIMSKKNLNFAKLYHENIDDTVPIIAFNFDEVDAVKKFDGTHPAAMQERISQLNWKVNIDESKIRMKFKDKILFLFEKLTGYRLFEYKNFI
ncbi:MAG: hypothetical protein J6V74_02255, partial [Bacteroidales bacterium]|nr:hypothetical protein [Bacteroidales bacterium]